MTVNAEGLCSDTSACDRRATEVFAAREDDPDGIVDICSECGETETVELHDIDLDGREQSITICAECGSDQR